MLACGVRIVAERHVKKCIMVCSRSWICATPTGESRVLASDGGHVPVMWPRADVPPSKPVSKREVHGHSAVPTYYFADILKSCLEHAELVHVPNVPCDSHWFSLLGAALVLMKALTSKLGRQVVLTCFPLSQIRCDFQLPGQSQGAERRMPQLVYFCTCYPKCVSKRCRRKTDLHIEVF